MRGAAGSAGLGDVGEEDGAKPKRGESAEAIHRCGDWMNLKEGGLRPLACFCSGWGCIKMERRS